MSISTYSELATAIATYEPHSDIPAQASSLVALAEARFNLEFRCREMESTSSGTFSGETLAAPADFLEVRAFRIDQQPETVLDYLPPREFFDQRLTDTNGEPVYYTNVGTTFHITPNPGTGYSYNLDYYASIPGLESNSTNWLLTKHPGVYLFGSLVEAKRFLQDDGGMAFWEAQYQQAKALVMGADKRARWGGGAVHARPW